MGWGSQRVEVAWPRAVTCCWLCSSEWVRPWWTTSRWCRRRQAYLVGGLVAIWLIFQEILRISSSQLTFIFFRGVQTTTQLLLCVKKRREWIGMDGLLGLAGITIDIHYRIIPENSLYVEHQQPCWDVEKHKNIAPPGGARRTVKKAVGWEMANVFLIQLISRLNFYKSAPFHNWLVVWLPFFIFPEILGISSSQLTFIFFRGVQTTNQTMFSG